MGDTLSQTCILKIRHVQCISIDGLLFIQNLKTEYNTLAPVYSSCVEGGQSLSSMCQEGEPKKDMDTGIQDLQVQWDQLNSQFGDILQKLNDALVQTQEFQGIANGLDRWMDTMGSTLRQQKRIAARVKLIEPQVEGFRVRYMYTCILSSESYSNVLVYFMDFRVTCSLWLKSAFDDNSEASHYYVSNCPHTFPSTSSVT